MQQSWAADADCLCDETFQYVLIANIVILQQAAGVCGKNAFGILLYASLVFRKCTEACLYLTCA